MGGRCSRPRHDGPYVPQEDSQPMGEPVASVPTPKMAIHLLPFEVTAPNGDVIEVDSTALEDNTIASLRREVATKLGQHYRKIQLVCKAEILADAQPLSSMLEAAATEGEPVMVTAVIQELTDKELKEHIRMSKSDYGFTPYHDFLTLDMIDPDKYGASYRRPATGDAWRPEFKSGEMDPNQLEFPAPRDININMLPFIMGKKDSLPEEYHHYWPIMDVCTIGKEEIGKVGYLTIQESLVPAGETQRRPGLHIETPGLVLTTEGKYVKHSHMWGCGLLRVNIDHDPEPDNPRVEGGIYMASNVGNSCRLWNASILDPGLVVGHHGDLEHCRELLDKFAEREEMSANVMYWLTDRTPHEALPLQKQTYRQFFRLVTNGLSAWFPEHSTSNRLGTKPDSSITTIIPGSKFV